MTSTQLRLLAVFSLGYFVSYLFRGVNLGFAPFIIRDLGASPADLGTLTSLYFLGFAGAQIPVGVMLDRFGARRVTACVMLVAAAGALCFSSAHGLGAMMAGRFLIGVGVSACLGGAFKATAQHFDVGRLTFVNGIVMAAGGLGGVAVGAPLAWLLSVTGWRSVAAGLAVLTAAAAAAIWLGAPSKHEAGSNARVLDQFKGTWHVLTSRAFWKLAAFSGLTQSVFYAMQSLWVGAFMRDVALAGASEGPARAATLVSVLGAAFIAGNVGFGALARALERRGVSVYLSSGATMVLFVLVQALIAAQVPLPQSVLWAAYGALGGTGILTYAVLAEHFPARMLGRVNTTFTLVIFLAIFALQVVIGAVLARWPMHGGHYSAVGHVTVWTTLVVLQAAAAVWYFLPAGRARSPAWG
ncbi:MFS transporter [Trinickia diaoshuihuensis]|uniref:MFS transporter n=1 Tax=Trinickia diaoshuihuensis TaxID=2292265 RepID=UPI000E267239|nr:MFS transporter [Trinickia diaoshuihuensis]